MSSKQKSARHVEVRRIFQTIYPNATATDVLTFYTWLEENSPDLLPSSDQEDQFRQLKSELEGLWGNRPVVKKTAKKKGKREPVAPETLDVPVG